MMIFHFDSKSNHTFLFTQMTQSKFPFSLSIFESIEIMAFLFLNQNHNFYVIYHSKDNFSTKIEMFCVLLLFRQDYDIL